MNAKRMHAAAGVILAAQQQGQAPAGIAAALEAAGLLQSPESAAELVAVRGRVAELEMAVAVALAPHVQHSDSVHCSSDGEQWPCLVVRTLAPEGWPVSDSQTVAPSCDSAEYRYCGADLGRAVFPFTCYRHVAHTGPCSGSGEPQAGGAL
ncbi:hypothetical protein ACWCPT_05965 [Streptomyces sp. NPDC002308]